MTATWTNPPISKANTEDVPLPKPEPFSAPVLIGDCVTPLAGETILAHLWRRLDRSETDQ